MNQQEPKRFQCRHIFTDGRRCGSHALRNEHFCYYHHNTRKPIANPKERKARLGTFDLPLPSGSSPVEDRSAIQAAVGEIIQRIASNDLDPRRAGLLLYALQIASLNLPKERPTAEDEDCLIPPTVDEVIIDPELGPLAPEAEAPPAIRSARIRLLEWRERDLDLREHELAQREAQLRDSEPKPPINRQIVIPPSCFAPTHTIPNIKATADKTTNPEECHSESLKSCRSEHSKSCHSDPERSRRGRIPAFLPRMQRETTAPPNRETGCPIHDAASSRHRGPRPALLVGADEWAIAHCAIRFYPPSHKCKSAPSFAQPGVPGEPARWGGSEGWEEQCQNDRQPTQGR